MSIEIQSFQENEFPAFPVVFQQQTQQLQDANRQSGPKVSGIFKKYPLKQINELKQHLSGRNAFDCSILFTQEIQKLPIQTFIKTYIALNLDFFSQLKKNPRSLSIYKLSAQKLYIGLIQSQKCNGKGILLFKNGNIYQGQFKDNKRHGKGIYLERNLGWYQGEWKFDVKEGHGVEVRYDKFVYKGQFVHGHRHNHGIYVDSQHNQYSGEWRLGIMHGKAYLKTKQSIFYGTLVNWLKHGQGQEKFIQGHSYKGNYQNGRFDGFGTYKWKNSAIYQGSFKNGFRHGKGKWILNQTKYLGNYVEGLKQGYGQLYLPSGNFYKGNFVQDKRQGYGEMFWNDSSFYKGEWKCGVQNGKGQLSLNGGQITSGWFQNSILVQVTATMNTQQNDNDVQNQQNQLFSAQPRGILGSRDRTYSQKKSLHYGKRLTKIDQTIRKPHNSTLKSKLYFKSPEKSEGSLSKQHESNINTQGYTTQSHTHGHGHGHSRQCKCVKRLQNFRLKQTQRSKISDSRFNNT